MTFLALTDRTGLRLAEVGFLLAAIAGALLGFGAVTRAGARTANLVAGLALAAGAVLLIIAAHWGHFG
jgi:hypothetical protein